VCCSALQCVCGRHALPKILFLQCVLQCVLQRVAVCLRKACSAENTVPPGVNSAMNSGACSWAFMESSVLDVLVSGERARERESERARAGEVECCGIQGAFADI